MCCLRWVEGVYFKHDTVKVCFSSDDPKPRHLIIQDGFCDWGFEPPIIFVEVDPETVGQFTGLKDENGKWIFEGDIVKTGGIAYGCRWDDGNFEFGLYNKKESFGIAYADLPISVIGNIHDNPELLEVN